VRAAAWALLLGLLFAGCAEAGPSATASPLAASPEPAPTEDATARCPGLEFDATASLDPMFDEESFATEQSASIGAAFVDGLARLYAGDPGADPCAVFTGPGLDAAVALDPRLGPALAGTTTLDADLVLRNAGEGTYDLRERPPRVPVDVVYDIPAGATTTDAASGATDTTDRIERVGLRVTFAYDGSAWLADRVEQVPPQDAAWWALPSPVAELRACKGFRDDPDRLRFDDEAGTGVARERQRRWCADGGRGGALPADLVSLSTRFPCDWGRIAILTIGWPLGTRDDILDRHQYLRDPDGQALEQGWLHEGWMRDVRLPDGAEDTGWTNGNMNLWIDRSEAESAVYVRTGGRYERWPRGDDPSVTDCN
jgi:hypothetical protein